MNTSLLLLAILFEVLVLGCAGKQPETRFYQLAVPPSGQPGGEARAELHCGAEIRDVATDEGPRAGERLVQHDAERELIALRIGRRARELLGGHVRRRAEQRAGLHGPGSRLLVVSDALATDALRNVVYAARPLGPHARSIALPEV